MKPFIKTIRTITAVLMIVAGLTALCIIDNAEGITTLIAFAIVMLLGVIGGVYLLYSTYPELADLSEFEEETNSILEDYEKEIKELREENLLLIARYLTFKSIIRSSNAIDESNKEKYLTLYHLIYEEDLICGKTNSQEPSLDELDRFKEIYN